MGKYRKSLFILFVISLFLLVDNVSAETIQNTCSSINQNCSTKSRYTYSLYGSTDDFYTGAFGSRYSGKADYLVFDFDYDLLGNSTYLLTISASDIDFRNISKSNTYMSTSQHCGDGTGTELQITNVSYSQSKVVITFKTVSSTPRFILIFGEDGSSKYVTAVNTFGFSSVDITTVESNDTQNIIDNANQNSQAIIDNNKENTESIIGNNDKNTQDIIDNQNELLGSKCQNIIDLSNFQTQTISGISFTNNNDGTITINGTATNSFGITFFRPVLEPGVYSMTSSPVNYYIYDYNTNTSIITQGETTNITNTYNNIGVDTWIDSGKSFNNVVFKPMLTKSNSQQPFCKFGSYSSKLDDVSTGVSDINGTLNDDSPPNTDNFISNLQGLVNDGPISTLILMPFTLLNRYVEGFSGSCTPIDLGNLYGTDLTMSCINISSIVGSELWNIIDGLISIFMIYNIAMLFVSVFNDITSLRDTFDSLYTPQHAKTLGKHTSEVA